MASANSHHNFRFTLTEEQMASFNVYTLSQRPGIQWGRWIFEADKTFEARGTAKAMRLLGAETGVSFDLLQKLEHSIAYWTDTTQRLKGKLVYPRFRSLLDQLARAEIVTAVLRPDSCFVGREAQPDVVGRWDRLVLARRRGHDQGWCFQNEQDALQQEATLVAAAQAASEERLFARIAATPLISRPRARVAGFAK